jgi:hypothetical protein
MSKLGIESKLADDIGDEKRDFCARIYDIVAHQRTHLVSRFALHHRICSSLLAKHVSEILNNGIGPLIRREMSSLIYAI